jgi:membrane associated rhomboid family serine protease
MKITYNAPVVLTYTLICTIITTVDFASGAGENQPGWLSSIFFTVYPFGTIDNYQFAAMTLSNPLTYMRLFSHAMGHAGWGHLVGNFSFILLIGPILEEKYGSRALLLMIFITALFTGVLNATLFPNALLGASGIVFMMILLISFTNAKKGSIPLTFILITLLYLGKEITNAIGASDQISQFAHIMGGIFGGLFGFFANNLPDKGPSPNGSSNLGL